MTDFDPRSLLRRKPEPKPPTLRDWVEAELGDRAPQGGLANRAAARAHLRGRGPHMHFTVRHSVEDLMRAAQRRQRRLRKRRRQRVR